MFKVGAPSGHDCAPPSIPIKISQLATTLGTWSVQHKFLGLLGICWTPQRRETKLGKIFDQDTTGISEWPKHYQTWPASIPIKFCPQLTVRTTTCTLHNFSRWFQICNLLQSEEIHLKHHFPCWQQIWAVLAKPMLTMGFSQFWCLNKLMLVRGD